MSKLSPSAHAVLNVLIAKWEADPYEMDVVAIAAALRAAADQVVPEEQLHGGDQRWQFERDARQHSRKRFLAIADELEAL